MTLSVLFSCFVNQELVLKQPAELKENHIRTSERSSEVSSFSDPFSSGGVFHAFVGPGAPIEPFRGNNLPSSFLGGGGLSCFCGP